MLEIKNISKKYPLEKQEFIALDNLSLSFPNVEFVSVLGPSGCGKTTLLNCIGGLDKASSGEILFNGKDILSMNDRELDSYRNNQIGFVFQNYFLIPQLTVLDNVKIALEVRNYSLKEVERLALDALKRVSMYEMRNKKPNQLSGGQQQRVALARAIVTSPKIILADEPTGALDSESSLSIMNLLKDLSKDRLVIMVTHNEELAKKYSSRILYLKDGRLEKEEILSPMKKEEDQELVLKKSKLSFRMSLKLAIKNVLSRKVKTILAGIANSFGMIGIGFFLAINSGFSNYSSNLSAASATSLPVVVTAYNRKSTSDKYADKNASVSYPDTDEIYPKVDLTSQYSYTYNHFSKKYLSYLDSLKNEGILREYTLSYGNDYSFNLVTKYPESLNGGSSSYYGMVDTSATNYNYYAYQADLPYNIFHVLYGDLDQYDLICGQMPTEKNQLVLVVDQYNSIGFSILQKLGFYNQTDKQADVEDASLTTKVKPIKFSDILNKEYRIYDNDELYQDEEIQKFTDALGYERETYHYTKKTIDDDFFSNKGTSLKISGIIRPKKTSPFTILSPSLCYLPSLQEEMAKKNEESSVAKNIKKNLVFSRPSDLDSSTSALEGFTGELETVVNNYKNSKNTILPTSEINSVFSRYFIYWTFDKKDGSGYYGFQTYLSTCRKHGVSLVKEELLGKDLSDEETLQKELDTLSQAALKGDVDTLYSTMISLLAYSNAYSNIESLVLFPTDLSMRSVLLTRLDEFNTISEDETHALNEEEKVYYVKSDGNAMLEEVGEMISLVSLILLLFAAISLVVSSSMTALLTSNNVLERKKEIGLLRAIGSKKSDVVKIFEIEALLLGALSGIIGSLMTFVLSFPINALINHYYSYYHVGTICNFTFLHAIIIVLFSIIVGILASLIPSLKASKENPVDALRSE